MSSSESGPDKKGSAPNPLDKFSLLGRGVELAKHALELRPLLGFLCLSGEASVWYAKYGTGKTLLALHLLIEAIQDGRLRPENTYYINADDSSAGLAQKVRLLDDLGVHVLAEGHLGFNARGFLNQLRDVIATGRAANTFILIDTLKKFVDVMDKKASREFTSVIRQFVLQGGTFLALAHTNKRPGADGKPIPEGTADILNDSDSGYLLDCVGEAAGGRERLVEFTCVKSRGFAIPKVYYAYDAEPSLPYEERLCSVHEIDPEEEKYAGVIAENPSEADAIEAIEICIQHGRTTKMDIARTASLAAKQSRRSILRTIEKYTGDDPEVHRWAFSVGAHGAMTYRLLDPHNPTGSPPAAD